MKKTLLILTAPLLLVDACASVHLAQQDIANGETKAPKTFVKPESISQSAHDPQKQIVIRELSNGEFDLSTRFQPAIKDHYRKTVLQVKAEPEF